MVNLVERRERQRDTLVLAAESAIAAGGLRSLKARDLAREVGCSLGAIYNLVADIDELVLHVGSRTLSRLDAELGRATQASAALTEGDPVEALVAIAKAYCAFARENLQLWRTLFEHRMADGASVPDWAVADRMILFRYILAPLRRLRPEASETELQLLSRTLFSAVHGIVMLGLEENLIAVPTAALDSQIEAVVRLLGTALQQPAQS